ncbi:MAG: PEP-CTERM sorting domain-containing protein [Sphingomonas sanxanigenens]|uniref:PEP-CTERM sorting domain-containing protein n=1 Tax=Sphingomonas sanxanigenens TaxID=397260 RepID=A0A2W5A5Q0_9SPHN|nr:MAG: PEP-CTERM sorting domain-containing protein [Sphingomonas sanxanigenens]
MRAFAIPTTIAAAVLATALPTTAAEAATLIVDVTGVRSFDGFGDSTNSVFNYNIGAGATITGVTYNVTIRTVGLSWLSEAQIFFTDSAITAGVVLTPGIGDNFSGTATYSNAVDLVAQGLSFSVGADGILRLEFAEDYDDYANAADAIYTTGSLTFTYTPANAVPEPAVWAMMVGGFGLVGAGLRRRRARIDVTYA